MLAGRRSSAIIPEENVVSSSLPRKRLTFRDFDASLRLTEETIRYSLADRQKNLLSDVSLWRRHFS